MKRIIFMLLAVVALYSCEKDNDDIIGGEPKHASILQDAGEIEYAKLESKCYSIGTLSTLSDVYFDIEFMCTDQLKDKQLWDSYHKYINTRTEFIINDYSRISSGDPGVFFFSAYINGEVEILCDKTLFGKASGENLASYFGVLEDEDDMYCIPIGRENPKLLYSFTDEKPKTIDGYFIKDTWLKDYYRIRANQEPTEKYDDITLTVSIPVSREYITDYLKSQQDGTNAKLKVVDNVLTASCKIQFQK